MNPVQNEQNKADKQYDKDRGALEANIRELAKTKHGKSLIWEVLSMCGLYASTFTGNSQGAFLEGKRAVGLELLQLLEDADGTIYPKLLLEMMEK